MAFEAFCQSVTGQYHVQKNMSCEDYGLAYTGKDGECVIFAVADGLGDLRCVRSGIGSRLACEAARDCLAEFAERMLQEGRDYTCEQIEARISDELIKPVCKAWRERVGAHFKSVEMTAAEKAASGTTAPGDDFRAEKLYNTTLIAGLLLKERYLILLQQGDGHCVVLDENGEPSFPIPWDEDCIWNITTVMGGHDVEERMRFALLDLRSTKISACFLATDGLEDSFTSLDELSLELDAFAIEAASVPMAEYLPWLDEKLSWYARYGSGDDITVAAILDVEHIASIRDTWREKIEAAERIAQLEKTVLSAEDKIRSMTRKHENLERQYYLLKERAERKKAELSLLDGAVSELEQALAQVGEEYETCHTSFLDQIKRRDEARAELEQLKGGER